MTVRELIEILGDAEPDSEVRIAYQPSYPLRAAVAAVALESEVPDGESFVWIAATSSVGYDENPYVSSDAWEGIR